MIYIKNKYKIKDNYVEIYLKDRNNNIYISKVDLSDFKKLKNFKYSWYPAYQKRVDDYYAVATEHLGYVDDKWKSRSVYMHRYILDIQDKNIKVDHINHDTLDNRRCNIRAISNNKNTKNRIKANKNGTTGIRNVSWINSAKKYLVQFQVDGKNTCFGRFNKDEFDKACKLANKLRKELYGDYGGKDINNYT